ncbi:uncharacterized protein LOC132285840 isoform X2 [Cornus florida]|uniref:uncharacterized protein LOC132285840 isoform X2 n=1 Tax=Cornus florida TaxID=4283 RepID=UPI002899A700|nr:uncharacterized protein LOC132285840 isoform X2 [Cornus florida]
MSVASTRWASSFSASTKRMQQQREDFNVIRFLTGLSPEYEPIRAQILDGPSLPSLTDVFRRLQRATQSNGASGVHNDNGGDSSTLTVSQGGPNSFRRGRGREPLRCTHCGRPNHTVNYCWDLHGRPKLSGYANQVSNNEDATSSPAPLTCSPQAAESDMITITRDEYDQLMSQQQPLSSSSMVFFAQSGSQDEEEDWYVRQGR